MDELHPCSECNRHYRIGDEACPFCRAQRSRPGLRLRVRAGRFTRAAVFSGALIGGLVGCGDDEAPLDASATADAAAAVDGGVADASTNPDAEVADASTDPDAFIPLPYGAPPARSRVI